MLLHNIFVINIVFGLAFICFCLNQISLSKDFTENPLLGRDINVIVIVKDFNQMQRAELVWNERNRGRNDITLGRKSRERLEKGMAFGIKLDKDFLSLNDSLWYETAEYAAGMDFFFGGKNSGENRMAFSRGDNFMEINLVTGESKMFENKWMRHIHTLEYNKDGTKILVCATGYDILFEIDLATGEIVWEWAAMENGFQRSSDGSVMTRDLKKFEVLREIHENVLLVDTNIPVFKKGLPLQKRCCHLSNAFYLDDDDDTVGVTFGHQHMLSFVSMKNNDNTPMFDRLGQFPHGFRKHGTKFPCKGYVVADTMKGNILFLDETFTPCTIIDIKTIPSMWMETDPFFTGSVRDAVIRGAEWFQYVTQLKDHLYSAVDVKRRHIVLFDMMKKEYRVIPFSQFMAIQDVKYEPPQLSQLLVAHFGKDKKNIVEEEEEGDGGSYYYDEEMEFGIYDAQIIGQENKVREMGRIKDFRKVILTPPELEDFKKLCSGEYYPLTGFMNEDDYECILHQNTLCDGSVFWDEEEEGGERKTVVKGVKKDEFREIEVGEVVTLVLQSRENPEETGEPLVYILGAMEVESKFQNDKGRASFMLYGKGKNVVARKKSDRSYRYMEGGGPEFGYDARVRDIFYQSNDIIGGRIISCLL